MATFRYGEFEWDTEKAALNFQKHGVSFEEAATVFSDPRALDVPDLVHSDRFVIVGLSQQARVLFIVHAERGESIRIISARKATPSQRRRYENDE